MLSFPGSRAICLALLSSVVIYAGTIDIFSSPGTGSNNRTGVDVSVPPAPTWAVPSSSDYGWISYAATGCNTVTAGVCTPGPQAPPATSVTGTPTAIFYQTFTLAAGASGSLNVWADDTATVWIDSGTVISGDGSAGIATLEWSADGTVGTTCVTDPIGCTQDMNAVIPLSLSAGSYTLVIDAYQLVSGTPFGVMYDGALTTTTITSSGPEPASFMLMGLGLAGIGMLIRRRGRQ